MTPYPPGQAVVQQKSCYRHETVDIFDLLLSARSVTHYLHLSTHTCLPTSDRKVMMKDKRVLDLRQN